MAELAVVDVSRLDPGAISVQPLASAMAARARGVQLIVVLIAQNAVAVKRSHFVNSGCVVGHVVGAAYIRQGLAQGSGEAGCMG